MKKTNNIFTLIGEVSAQLKKIKRWDLAKVIAGAISNNLETDEVDEALIILNQYVEVESSA